MGTKLVRASLCAGLVLLVACGVVLLATAACTAATGVAQPIVELQQNAWNELTYPSTFYGQKTSGTDSGTKQQYKFQRQREGKNFDYVIADLTPNNYYSVEMSFVEHKFSAVGQRVFNVYLQGTLKISRFDIYRNVGKNAAVQTTLTARADASGNIVVLLRSDQAGGVDYATISTIRVYSGATNFVEIDSSASRLTASTPVRMPATSSRNTYETVLSRLGSRFCLNLVPQKLSSRMSPMGDGTGDLQDLVLGLSNGSTMRVMPFTDRYPVWENVVQSHTMTSQGFTGTSAALPFTVSTTFTAPFYPQDDKLSGAPFIYLDVTVKNNSAVPVSPTFVVARPQRQDFASSAVSEFSTATVTGMDAASRYSYYDESYNAGKSHLASEVLAVPAGEAGDVDFRGSVAGEFGDFNQGQLWGYTSPAGYPYTYNDYKHPLFSFYPRGYTGAVWSIHDLGAGAVVTKHFVLAGYIGDQMMKVTNRAYSDTSFRFRYTTQFASSHDVADYALGSRWTGDNIQDKTQFFDSTVSSDSYLTLPGAYRDSVRNMLMYGFQSYLMNAWWLHSDAGRDWFSVWEGSSCRFHSTIDVEYNDAWFYYDFWPGLLKTLLSEWPLYRNACPQGTYLSHDMGIGDAATGQVYPSAMPVEENANYVLMLFKYWKSTGDAAFMQSQYSTVRNLVDFMMNCDQNNNGLPDINTQNTLDQSSLALQKGKDQVYLGTKCLAAYQAAKEMAASVGDTAYAAKCNAGVELINETLANDMWLSDHFAVCSDQVMAAADQDAYSIYPSNGLLYLLSGTRSVGLTTGNTTRMQQDLVNSTEKTLKTYGCSHTTYDAYNEWVSQNIWRDSTAAQLGIGLHNNNNPLAMCNRYWSLEKYFAQSLNGSFWDVVVYPGGTGAGGMSVSAVPWESSTGAGAGKTPVPYSVTDESGGASAGYSQSLGYYPRGAAAFGLIDAVAGLTLDSPASALYYQNTTYPLRVPVFARANWSAADPATRVPTMYFGGPSTAPALTNRALLPAKVAARNMRDIAGMSAGSHAISPNTDGVNDTVRVSYSLPASARVSQSIWCGSTLVKSWADFNAVSGAGSFTWDGKDSSGRPVQDGTYTARVDAVATNAAIEIRPATATVMVNDSVPDLSRTWYLAEGFTGHNATGGDFEEYVLIQNPNPVQANADVTFMMPGGKTMTRSYTVAANSRFTITVNDLLPDAEVSTCVHADIPIAVERAMYFSGRKAGHDSIGVSQPSKTWYMAEGYTAQGWDDYVLIQNPGDSQASITAQYMTPGAGNVTRQYSVGPHSRFTIHVNDIVPAQSVSTQIDSSVPVVVERAQYLNNMTAGTCSIGACSTSSTWYLAEGYTAQGFEEYVLVQNPQSTSNNITVTFMESNGNNTTKQYQLPAKSRFTIGVNDIFPASEVSTKVRSQYPVLVERAMYWNNRSDGHDSIGTPTPDSTWYLPEGYTDQGFETWVLIQNPGDSTRKVDVTFMEKSGRNTTQTYQVPPRSRFTVSMNKTLPASEASTRVSADGPVIVERAVYFNNRSGGTDSIGIRGY